MTSKIPWTDETWNPIVGCRKESDGCRNCYAERLAKRLVAMGIKKYNCIVNSEGWTGIVSDENQIELNKPKCWKKPRKIFVCSMSDLFYENVDASIIWKIFNVAVDCPQHKFLFLTKRPERMCNIVNEMLGVSGKDHLPENVWVGTTVENQEVMDERINYLLQTNALHHFVSVEPMLEQIDLTFGFTYTQRSINGILIGNVTRKLDWVICGGENGPGARPLPEQAVYSLVHQCEKNKVPFFFKGWGGGKNNIIDGLLYEQWPIELR